MAHLTAIARDSGASACAFDLDARACIHSHLHCTSVIVTAAQQDLITLSFHDISQLDYDIVRICRRSITPLPRGLEYSRRYLDVLPFGLNFCSCWCVVIGVARVWSLVALTQAHWIQLLLLLGRWRRWGIVYDIFVLTETWLLLLIHIIIIFIGHNLKSRPHRLPLFSVHWDHHEPLTIVIFTVVCETSTHVLDRAWRVTHWMLEHGLSQELLAFDSTHCRCLTTTVLSCIVSLRQSISFTLRWHLVRLYECCKEYKNYFFNY